MPKTGTFAVVALLLGIALAFLPQLAMAAEPYVTQGDCDGYPRIDVKTAPGTCLGLVATQLGFARGVMSIGDDIYVTDMGGWQRRHGRLLRLGDKGRAVPVVLLRDLDEPASLAPAPNGAIYLGMEGKVIRLDPRAADPAASVRDVVTGLPSDGLHPLAALAVAADGSLYINVGSATDHCEGAGKAAPDPAQPCPETVGSSPRATVIHVMPGSAPVDARTVAPYVRGLRNTMALTVLASGKVIAGVNARDAINKADPSLSDADLPHDTFDRLDEGADYGWPYCYDNDVPSPEYPHFDCATKHQPTMLLPPHAAPLGMLIYHGKTLPGLDGLAIMTLHGYRALGHKLVALAIDSDGMPKGPLQDVVSDWLVVKGSHPQGAPVSIDEQDDGSILVTEDHNGTLLRLARSVSAQ